MTTPQTPPGLNWKTSRNNFELTRLLRTGSTQLIEGRLSMTDQLTGLKALMAPFPPNQISKLPKPTSKDNPKGKCSECGGWHGLPAVHLDYVGHAALTARLLEVDPMWTWEPVGFDDKGLPALEGNGGLWIKLTVLGVTRFGYGDAQGKTGGDAMKERIGDALRNAGMRFGMALDLWHKGDLWAHEVEKPEGYDNWKANMRAVADEGTENLKAAWKKSDEALRLWATDHDPTPWWEATKERAANVRAAA